MTFDNPVGLFGLLAVPVIVLLHLLRERRHRQIVSNVNLWSFLDKEVHGPQPSRIPITWLLILDILIGALLAIAWAGPVIELSLPEKGARHIVILLDVSASMQARDWSPDRFSKAVLDVTQLINDLNSHDIATIITFGEKSSYFVDTRQVEVQEILSRLIDLKADEIGHEIDAAFMMGLAILNRDIPSEFHVFTDGAFPLNRQESINLWRQFSSPIYWHLYSGMVSNQAVLDVEVKVMNDNYTEVFARVANFSNQSANRLLVLLSDGGPLDSKKIDIPANSTTTHLWRLNKPATVFSVSLAEGDQYPLDDTFTTGVVPNKVFHIVYVTDNPAPIDLAIEALPGTELTILSPDEYAFHYTADLTIFRDTLPDSWPTGDVMIIDPPEDMGISDPIFPPRLRQPTEISSIESLQVAKLDPLLNEVDFGSVRWGGAWSLSEIPPEFSAIVQVGNTPILMRGQQGSSDVTVLLAHLDSGNFTKDPAFIILLANVVSGSRETLFAEELPLGHAIILPSTGDYQVIRISPPIADNVEYRQSWPALWESTSDPGAYLLELEDMSGKPSVFAVGINAADKDESQLHPQDWVSEVDDYSMADASSKTTDTTRLINLMPYLLGLVIFLMLMEAILAWR